MITNPPLRFWQVSGWLWGQLSTFDIFRHTFGTNASAQGANAFILKEMMGQSSMQTTMKYVHLQPDDLKAKHNIFSVVNEVFKSK